MRFSKRLSVTVLIPALNEEKTVGHCVASCLAQTDVPESIIVVNDCSSDRTLEVLAAFDDPRVRVINTEDCTGSKSRVQEIGLKHVTTDIVVTTDADTLLHYDFVKVIRKCMSENLDVMAVAGAVESLRHNYLTALRDIDYVVGTNIYKRAQSAVGFIHVIPGCAGAFRTALFRDGTLNFEHDTLTEDLDITYKLHDQGQRIYFEPNAIAYTQDPHTLTSYIIQMRRWYGGAWQNIRKHWTIARFPGAALMLTLSYMDGLLFASMLFALPLIDMNWFISVFVMYVGITLILGLYAAICRNRLDMLIYSPMLIGLNVLQGYIFIEQFINEIIFRRSASTWYSPLRRESRKSVAINT